MPGPLRKGTPAPNDTTGIEWEKYKIRRCRTLHECRVCGDTIVDGEEYHDGGYGRRAHVECVVYNVGKGI